MKRAEAVSKADPQPRTDLPPENVPGPPLCKWHPALRWIVFLPAGCVATMLVQAGLRLVGLLHESDLWGGTWGYDSLAAAAEPLAFLAAALWVLPRFHRTFTLLLAVPYCAFELLFALDRISHSDSPWWDGSLPAISFVSGICTAVYFVRHYTKTEHCA